MASETVLELTTGEKIIVIDNAFTDSEASSFESYFDNSRFTLGGPSKQKKNQDFGGGYFQRVFEENDIHSLKLIYTDGYQNYVKKHLYDTVMFRSWLVVSTYFTYYTFHTDSSDVCSGSNIIDKTVLYYGNNNWNDEWGGETLFKNSKGVLERAVSFKPGRIVIFDSSLSHKAAPMTVKSDPYRFSYVMLYTNRELNERGQYEYH